MYLSKHQSKPKVKHNNRTMPRVMDTFYVLHSISAQMTEQNPAEELMSLQGLVQHIFPKTKHPGEKA